MKPKPYWKNEGRGKWRLWCKYPEHTQSRGILAIQHPTSDTSTRVSIQTTFGVELYIPSGESWICGVPRNWLVKELKLRPYEEIFDTSPDISAKLKQKLTNEWKKKIIDAINKYHKEN